MKRMWWGLLLAAAGLLSIPAVAGAAEYEAYVGCSTSVSASPSHDCQLGDSPGAFFEADEFTEYDVCVEFPDGEYLCRFGQKAEEGVLYVNQITSELTGLHVVGWWVGEELIGTWDFQLNAPPPPPAPPTPPAPPAPPAPPLPPAPTVSAACVKAKGKVRKFKKQLRKAVLPKQKARIRGKLNRTRSAVRRLC